MNGDGEVSTNVPFLSNRDKTFHVFFIKCILKILMWAVFLAWIALIFAFPSNYAQQLYENWIEAGTSGWLTGTIFLLFSGPVLVIAVLAVAYIIVSSTEDLLEKKHSNFPKSRLWTFPVLVDGPLGVVFAAEFIGIMLFAVYIVWSVSSYTIQNYKSLADLPSTEQSYTMLESMGFSFGQIGLFYLAFLFLPVARGSFLLRLIDIPFEQAIRYHIWLGHLTLLLFTLHGLCYLIAWAWQNCLLQEMSGRTKSSSKRLDPAWKYCKQVERNTGKSYLYVECNFCHKIVTGGVKRMKDHLAKTRVNVAGCEQVPPEVQKEMADYLSKGGTIRKEAKENFQMMAERGAYFMVHDEHEVPSPGYDGSSRVGSGGAGDIGSGGATSGSGHTSATPTPTHRFGFRGPMDRFMVGREELVHGSNTDPPRPPPFNAKDHRNKVCLDIGRFFFENCIPFYAACSPSFVQMIKSLVEAGRGFKPPTMYELRTWILQQEVKTTDVFVNEVKNHWPKTGVTIMSDGWKDIRGRHLINFIVNCPEGNIFLRTVDASEQVKDANLMCELLDEVIQEVGVEHVVQIVTDNASNYKKAGEMLMEKYPTIYWTPCAAHCIDLMLEKIGELPQHKNALLKAKKVSNFIYNHGWVLALMRSFTKKDLVRPAMTRFATAFLTLQSVMQNKNELQRMFTSKKWQASAYAKTAEGKSVRKIVLNDRSFWASLHYALKTTKPLVYVLRLVDSDMPAMGFLYGAMDKAKEDIAKNCGDDVAVYKEIWDIIDEKWDFQMHRHLHAAAYYLNPQYHYDPKFSSHPEVKLGLYNCMDKLIADPNERVEVDLQLDDFRKRKGMFGRDQAENTRMRRSPADWWEAYGDGTPQAKKFAIRVLSLTCTASACERNWSTFNQVHTKRRNRLETSKLNALVYIMYNKKLKDRYLKKKNLGAQEETLLLDMVESDNEWIVEQEEEGDDAINMTTSASIDGGTSVEGGSSVARASRRISDDVSMPSSWHRVLEKEADVEALAAQMEQSNDDEEDDEMDEDPSLIRRGKGKKASRGVTIGGSGGGGVTIGGSGGGGLREPSRKRKKGQGQQGI